MADSGLSSLHFVNPHRSTGAAAGWTYRTVPARNPRSLPVAAVPLELDLEIVGAGRAWSVAEFHVETASTSLLVLVHGRLVHQWYREGMGSADLFLGASATKSLLSHLVGVAVRAGALELTDLVAEHVPELADCGYGRIPVGALVTMTSGVDWVEDHRDPVGPATALLSSFAGGTSSRAVLARVGTRCPPGTRFEYCTADSQVLDWVRERATGVPFPAALQQLWADLGATADAAVAVDGDGVALAGGGVAAVAGDWARIGQLQIHGTVDDSWGPAGIHLLDHDWVDEGSRPLFPFVTPGRLPSALSTHVGFGYHWWPLDELGARVSADGSRGQFVYVDRPSEVVVVKTSNWAYADPWRDRQCRDLSYLALATVADAARLPNREGVVQ
jgi:CubicO group peptidase (beta-lactamase class C family)